MIRRILIANRGEIAVRIINACNELGIEAISVYSKADENSMHVELADESICIGPPPATDSYLNIHAIISAAEIANVDAIHPGYGFLAENEKFARVCQACNIKFIGPDPESIALMGDKATAKKTMKELGLSVVPGSDGVVKDYEELLSISKEIGFPVMLKATAGGGGRGMRIVYSEDELKESFEMASSEAGSAFGNSGIYVEKFIENPRHIEFQVLVDSHGNSVILGERECSIQRRHQKLIEEAPSPFLTDDKRREIIKKLQEVFSKFKYEGAGTVEFIFDRDGNYYFMEMNTRIQVEHPITEMITGIDLVQEQIKIASGEKLSFSQEDIEFKGHSIECRVNAEDPETFRPTPGTINRLFIPGGFGVRVDTAAYCGWKILPYYDSLVAKLITFGSSREDAILKMDRALSQFLISGIKTTIPLHQRILHSKAFLDGNYNTNFLNEFNR